MPALAKSSAVVLAHSAETDLQQYVADVLLPKNGQWQDVDEYR